MDQGNEPKTVRLSMMRRTIAKRVKESWAASPRVTYTISVDTEEMTRLRKKANASLGEEEAKISYNHIIMKACALLLMEMPEINASITDKELILHPHVNIGIAVAVKNGLLVPNVKECESLGLRQLAKQAQEKITAAREGRIQAEDLQGATFTVTNLGSFGITAFSPIINQPEVAILGVCAIIDTPVVRQGTILSRPLMNLCLTADHRAVDGAAAARFLQRLSRVLEEPGAHEAFII